jgi:hypothetical protein
MGVDVDAVEVAGAIAGALPLRTGLQGERHPAGAAGHGLRCH